MITIEDLITACQQIKEEFGDGGHIVLHVINDAGELEKADFVYAFACDSEGNLCLMNNPPAIGNYTS